MYGSGAALVTMLAAKAPFVWLRAKQKKGQSAEWTGKFSWQFNDKAVERFCPFIPALHAFERHARIKGHRKTPRHT